MHERIRGQVMESQEGCDMEAAISQAAKARCMELEAQCEAKCKDIEAACEAKCKDIEATVEACVIAEAQAGYVWPSSLRTSSQVQGWSGGCS